VANGGVRDVRPSDEYWQAASEALSPEKSLARIDEKARHLVGSVGVVGAVLGAGGLVASQNLAAGGVARAFAFASSVLAFVAVAAALGASLLRFEASLPYRDLVAVRAWYDGQFTRAKLVVVAGVLLLCAVIVAAAAATTAFFSTDRHDPSLSLAAIPRNNMTAVSAKVTATRVASNELLHAELAATVGGRRTVIATGVSSADDDGKVSISFEATAPGDVSVELVARTDRRRCVVRLGDPATSPPACSKA